MALIGIVPATSCSGRLKHMNDNGNGETPTQLIWVIDQDGKPCVRWGLVAGYIGIVVGVNALAMLLISWFIGTRFNLPLVFAISCGAIACSTIVVELQRQRVLTGEWRFRLSILSCLILMLIAACFFAIIGNDIRANQLGHALNLALKTKLEELIDGGNVYISTIEGTGVSCDVSRASFSDVDLQKLIQLASERTPGISQITLLNLEKTSVTDVGLQALHRCPHLTHLFLPAFQLSNESIASLVACRNLKYLSLDESKLTSEQVTDLRKTLPNLILNGKRWKERRM